MSKRIIVTMPSSPSPYVSSPYPLMVPLMPFSVQLALSSAHVESWVSSLQSEALMVPLSAVRSMARDGVYAPDV